MCSNAAFAFWKILRKQRLDQQIKAEYYQKYFIKFFEEFLQQLAEDDPRDRILFRMNSPAISRRAYLMNGKKKGFVG